MIPLWLFVAFVSFIYGCFTYSGPAFMLTNVILVCLLFALYRRGETVR